MSTRTPESALFNRLAGVRGILPAQHHGRITTSSVPLAQGVHPASPARRRRTRATSDEPRGRHWSARDPRAPPKTTPRPARVRHDHAATARNRTRPQRSHTMRSGRRERRVFLSSLHARGRVRRATGAVVGGTL
ncbi:hypothetical protein GS506_29160 [Rhodococcus hoagii]|nr:hypothetical protein [Prescottella equi]